MNFRKIASNKDGWLAVEYDGDFSVFKTFDCGQCFRFDASSDSRFTCRVDGVAMGRQVSFAENGDGYLYVRAPEEDFYGIWLHYLALDTDYEAYERQILSALSGEAEIHMRRALEASRGIRILRQDPWEALCSFIISQNNNIPRIKKIIASLCRAYGEKAGEDFAFPAPEALMKAGVDELFALRTGFRAKYIYDAARKVATGELSLSRVAEAKSYGEAEKMLLGISGVGPKVAACTLLFGFGRTEAFPVDVWIKKVLDTRFPHGLDPTCFGDAAGVAQQYLFYYEKYLGAGEAL